MDLLTYAAKIIQVCRDRTNTGKNRQEKLEAIRQDMHGCFRGISPGGYAQFELRLIPEGPIVCARSYQIAHNISKHSYQRIVDGIKAGISHMVPSYNDSSVVDDPSIKVSDDIGRAWNITLSHRASFSSA